MQSSAVARERAILNRLRERYESEGYSFVVYPPRELVPGFLGNYQPDALALRGEGGIVIEVKGQVSVPSELRLSELARRFADQPQWRLEVIVDDSSAPEEIDAFSRSRLERELGEVDRLASQGHLRAAFIIGWGVLEAAVRTLGTMFPDSPRRPMGPAQIPFFLAYNGLVTQETAETLRGLTATRNAIVHGNLGFEVTQRDVATLRKILDELLLQLKQPA